VSRIIKQKGVFLIINQTINAIGSNYSVTSSNKQEDILDTFAIQLETTQANEEVKKTDEIELSKKLLADILSIFKTGSTVSEIESVEELIEEFKKRIKEEKPNQEQLAKMMEELEQHIAKIDKSVIGEALQEANTTSNQTPMPSFEILMQVQEQLKNSMQEANKLKIETLTKNNRINNTQEFELLKEFQNKS
jgi:hypothetical protein